jgi:hypothetical protein
MSNQRRRFLGLTAGAIAVPDLDLVVAAKFLARKGGAHSNTNKRPRTVRRKGVDDFRLY